MASVLLLLYAFVLNTGNKIRIIFTFAKNYYQIENLYIPGKSIYNVEIVNVSPAFLSLISYTLC